MRRPALFLGAALGASLMLTGAASAQLLGGHGGLAGGLTGGFGPGGLSGGLTGSAMGSGSLRGPDASRLNDTASRTTERASRAKHGSLSTAQSAEASGRAAGDTAALQGQATERQARAAGDNAALQGLATAQSASGRARSVQAQGAAQGSGDVSRSGVTGSGSAEGSASAPR